MSTLNSTFNKADSLVSVTLHHSSFSKDGENYGKVTRNTVTLENIIAAINEENRGIDPYMVQHAAILIQQQILKMLQQGNAVNVLDLGFLYIAVKGTVKGDNPSASDIPEFAVRFTPSSTVNDAVSNLVVDKIVLSDSSPLINIITDEWTKAQNSTLTIGRTCCIEGKRLKMDGEAPISFVMVDDEGAQVEGQEPVTVTMDKIIENTAGKLRFFIPENLTADASYKICLTTSYLNGKNPRKTPLTAQSEPIIVTA